MPDIAEIRRLKAYNVATWRKWGPYLSERQWGTVREDFSETGNADWFNEDLNRYRALSPTDIRAAAAQFLPPDKRVELVVEPEKKP